MCLSEREPLYNTNMLIHQVMAEVTHTHTNKTKWTRPVDSVSEQCNTNIQPLAHLPSQTVTQHEKKKKD